MRPSNSVSVSAGLTYAKATFDIDGPNCPTQFQASAPVVALGGARPLNSCYRYQYRNNAGAIATSSPVQDVRGGMLPASPKLRINLSTSPLDPAKATVLDLYAVRPKTADRYLGGTLSYRW